MGRVGCHIWDTRADTMGAMAGGEGGPAAALQQVVSNHFGNVSLWAGWDPSSRGLVTAFWSRVIKNLREGAFSIHLAVRGDTSIRVIGAGVVKTTPEVGQQQHFTLFFFVK